MGDTVFDALEFLADEDQWPLWPILPVKGPNFTMGVVVAGQGPAVFLKNLYDPTPLTEVPKRQYADFQALLDDGWRVD